MIELIVFDIDGTLTDGKITYDGRGNELKSFDVKDGMAIATWNKLFGKSSAIITGRKSEIVQRRANELGVKYLYQGVDNKLDKIKEIIAENGWSLDKVAAIGDDLNDYKMLSAVGLSFAPANASKHIKEIVNIVCDSRGGEGAAREMLEIIFEQENLQNRFLEAWK
jgi:3-deoxy-D-manno-octulosonate 8-phosphate phosphatase (KDO 8-P phosphatase)